MSVCLAVSGVRQRHLAAKHLPVQWWETVGSLWVDQAEKLEFVDVQVADRLHYGQLGHHLWGQKAHIGKFMCVSSWGCMYESMVVTACLYLVQFLVRCSTLM